MSQMLKGIFAVIAVSLTFGAVQLAFGHDLKSRFQSLAGTPQEGVGEAVDRTGKTDRLGRAPMPSVATQTVAFRVDRFPETSILVRIPAKAAGGAPAVIQIKDQRKAVTIACEPVVSVLAEIAKHLGPGRCVT